jgi:hypothetical protein
MLFGGSDEASLIPVMSLRFGQMPFAYIPIELQRTLRFAPQLFEGLDFTGKSGQAIFFCIFNGLIAQPVQFLPSFHVTSAPPILAPRSPF